MSAKNIYLIRHGQTQFNKLGLVQGSGIDSELNEVGRQQATAFALQFNHIPFDKIYTSKLKRTHQTVASFIDKNLPWQQLEGLNEISWGKKEGRIINAEDDRKYFEMINAWRKGQVDYRPEGGESPLDVQKRQAFAWKYIMANEHEQNILVCMHGRAIRILLCLLLDVPLSQMDKFSHHNVGLYLLSFDGKKYTIELENYIEHLAIAGLETPNQALNTNSIVN